MHSLEDNKMSEHGLPANRYAFTSAKNEGYDPNSAAIPPSLKMPAVIFGSLMIAMMLLLGLGVGFGTKEAVLTLFMLLLPIVLLGVPLLISVRKFWGGQVVPGALLESGTSKASVTTGKVDKLKTSVVDVVAYEFSFTSPVSGEVVYGKQATTEFRYRGPVAGNTVAVYFVNDKNYTLL
jgi:hypothetical protein